MYALEEAESLLEPLLDSQVQKLHTFLLERALEEWDDIEAMDMLMYTHASDQAQALLQG